MIRLKTIVFLGLVFISFGFLRGDNLVVDHQDSGPWKTHSYLLYDPDSKEAALIDPGWPIDKLLTDIDAKNLFVKYVFITHCHQDHIHGVPKVIKKFPKAKLIYSKLEYKTIPYYSKWRSLYTKEAVKSYESNEQMTRLMDFNYGQLKKPDIYTEEGQKYKLGNCIIKILKTPGHSEGSVSYYTKNSIFSGDIINYNTIGYINYRFGSKDVLIKSVKKLYMLFADRVVIYPGHGPKSTIGYERIHNKIVTLDR